MVDGFSGKGRPPFAGGYADTMLTWLQANVTSKK